MPPKKKRTPKKSLAPFAWPVSSDVRAVAKLRAAPNLDQAPNGYWDPRDWASLNKADRIRAWDYAVLMETMIDKFNSNEGPKKIVKGWQKGVTPRQIARLGNEDGPGWGQTNLPAEEWKWPFEFKDWWNESLRWKIADAIWGPKQAEYADNWKEAARKLWERAARKYNAQKFYQRYNALIDKSKDIIAMYDDVDKAEQVYAATAAALDIHLDAAPFPRNSHQIYWQAIFRAVDKQKK